MACKGAYYLAILAVLAYIVKAIFQTVKDHSNQPEDKTVQSIHVTLETWGTAGFYIAILLYFICTLKIQNN